MRTMFVIHGLNVQVNFHLFSKVILLPFVPSEGRVSVERACMSPHTAEYRTINKLLRGKDNDCIKRVNGLDCFKFCSSDNCN